MYTTRSKESLALDLERNVRYLTENTHRTHNRRFIPQSWNAFQRMRLADYSNVYQSQEQSRVPQIQTSTSNDTSRISAPVNMQPKERTEHVNGLKPLTKSVKSNHWARSWANHRAQQALIMRDTGDSRSESSVKEHRKTQKSHSVGWQRRSLSVRSPYVELDAKAAEVFERLRSIYVNNEERDRRLQRIRERISEFQQSSIRTEVNKSIQDFNARLKEDEKNRRQLRRVREKFSETKRVRLKTMHMSRNALEAPAVSRRAYGLPQEGKEFSVTLSSKKTTDDIKKMWRTAIVRQNCIDTFLNRVSQRNQNLPEIMVKSTIRSIPDPTQLSSPVEKHRLSCQNENPRNIKELTSQHENKILNQQSKDVAKIQTGILGSLESLSSEDYDEEA